MEANPLMTVTVTVPADLNYAAELARVGKGRVSRNLAAMNATIAEKIIVEHDRRKPKFTQTDH